MKDIYIHIFIFIKYIKIHNRIQIDKFHEAKIPINQRYEAMEKK